MRNTEPRMEHGLNTDLFRAGGFPSSRVRSSGKLADRGGNFRPACPIRGPFLFHVPSVFNPWLRFPAFLIHPFPGTEPAKIKCLTVIHLITPSRSTPHLT